MKKKSFIIDPSGRRRYFNDPKAELMSAPPGSVLVSPATADLPGEAEDIHDWAARYAHKLIDLKSAGKVKLLASSDKETNDK